MLRNYLLVAVRALRKERGLTAIHLFGLTAGIACCLLISVYVRHELSFDRFHEEEGRLHRAWFQEMGTDGAPVVNTTTPFVLGPTLAASFPEVEAVVRMLWEETIIGVDRPELTRQVLLVDPAFFETFTFPLRTGDPATALQDPNGVVLGAEVADELFGTQEAMGRTVRLRIGDEVRDFQVTGVAEEPPTTSSIQFDVVAPLAVSLAFFDGEEPQSWFQIYVSTYVLLRPDTSPAALAAKAPAMMREALADDYQEGVHTVGLQPIAEVRRDTSFPEGQEPVSDPRYATILAAIALFVLLVACINFVTLSVARSAQRAREVGVRKALGAERRQLAAQYWTESLVLTALAVVGAFGLAWALMPTFGALAERPLRLDLSGGTLLFTLGVLAAVGLGAGSYPALLLSGLDPVRALRDRLQLGGDKSLFRRVLVVVQFAVSIFLIAGTLVLTQQLRFLQQKNLGFDQEQVVVIPTGVDYAAARPIIERFEQALAAEPSVAAVTHSAYSFDEPWIELGYRGEGEAYREFNFNFGAAGFPEAMRLELVAGRFPDPTLANDSAAVLVNEALVQAFGLEDPLGHPLPDGQFGDHQIVGVVQDFNYESLHTAVEPMAYAVDPNRMFEGAENVVVNADYRRKISVRLRPGDVAAGLAMLERTWERAAPGRPFEYRFLDDALDRQYREEARLGKIAGVAAALAVLIACLGLFGLAVLTVARRRKEIGVRKVLGASVGSVVALLSRDFAALVAVGFVVAVPVAYVAMGRWLEGFAYRVDLGPAVFLTAGALALLVALATVGAQALRAATADPVQALRSE